MINSVTPAFLLFPSLVLFLSYFISFSLSSPIAISFCTHLAFFFILHSFFPVLFLFFFILFS